MELNKVVRLGTAKTYGGRSYSIFCKIEHKGGRLSITGVEGPTPGGNCLGGCGQIDMTLREQQSKISLAPGWTRATLAKFFDTWKQWHLNDMKAGTPAQQAHLATLKFPGYPINHYEWAKEELARVGLEPDNGYSYGSAWLKTEVPNDVLTFLAALPNSDKTPAWV